MHLKGQCNIKCLTRNVLESHTPGFNLGNTVAWHVLRSISKPLTEWQYSFSVVLSLARCHPRCHNKAVCRRPNICQCRPGFHGHRCEHADVTLTTSSWFEAHPGPTVSIPTMATVTMVMPASTTIPGNSSTSASSDASSDTRKTYSLHWQPPRWEHSS